MNRTELFDLIRNGENSTLEFKRDDIQNHALAKDWWLSSIWKGVLFCSWRGIFWLIMHAICGSRR